MAEPLKNSFNESIPSRLAAMVVTVWPQLNRKAFVRDALDGFEPLDLMARGRHIADVLRKHLPPDYERAVDILVSSAGERPGRSEGDGGMASFFYLPHVCFVERHGLDHFEASMRAQYELTQRFTAEFSIRPFLERHERATLKRLRTWTGDPNVHVRRLVSEGTRPRLPWAGRLRRFQADPTPVLELLERLKDDPEIYVRRSVANNLNDIGKDHPEVLTDVARRWMTDASEERQALVRHALRSAVKRCDPAALALLGFGRNARVAIEQVRIEPGRVVIGQDVTIRVDVRNTTSRGQRVLVDLRVHFVKSNGRTAPKVFKLTTLELPPSGVASCRKTISLARLTTRRPYAGAHEVEILLNGRAESLGTFAVVDAPAGALKARTRVRPSGV